MGGGAVLHRAADEFVTAVGFADEAGGAEARNDGGLKHEGDERELVTIFNFHAASMTREVGHWLSR